MRKGRYLYTDYDEEKQAFNIYTGNHDYAKILK
jgi:hypothetical protein